MGFDPISLFARTDQDNDLNGNFLSDAKAKFVSQLGSTIAYTLSAADNGVINGFGAGGDGTEIVITCPNNLPLGFNTGIMAEGAGLVKVVNGTGATIVHRLGHQHLAGQFAVGGVFVRFNASGTQAAFVLFGDTTT